MLTVEKCLLFLFNVTEKPIIHQNGTRYAINDGWDRQFINDLSLKAQDKKPMSTRQADKARRILEKYIKILYIEYSSEDVKNLLKSPVYNITPYKSINIPKQVKFAGGNAIAFRCSYNPLFVREMKKLKRTDTKASAAYSFTGDPYNLWVLEVNHENVEATLTLIEKYKFEVDQAACDFLCDLTDDVLKPNGTVKVEDGKLVIKTGKQVYFKDFIDAVIVPTVINNEI